MARLLNGRNAAATEEEKENALALQPSDPRRNRKGTPKLPAETATRSLHFGHHRYYHRRSSSGISYKTAGSFAHFRLEFVRG